MIKDHSTNIEVDLSQKLI